MPRFGYGYLLWLLPGARRQFALVGANGQRICVDPTSKLILGRRLSIMPMKSGDYGLHWSSSSARVAFGFRLAQRRATPPRAVRYPGYLNAKGSDAVKTAAARRSPSDDADTRL